MAGFPRALAPLVYDVKSYGAKGNGVTDDTAAIQAAITAAAVNGGVVFFPTGTYIVSATLPLKSTVRYVGAGSDVSVIKAKTLTTYLFSAIITTGGSIHDLGIRDLTLDGNSGPTGTIHLIHLNTQASNAIPYYNILWERVAFQNAFVGFHHMANNTSAGPMDNETRSFHCTFKNCAVGILTGGTYAEHVENCFFISCTKAGVGAPNGFTNPSVTGTLGPTTLVRILGCHFEGLGNLTGTGTGNENGIGLGCSQALIANNLFSNISKFPIWFESGEGEGSLILGATIWGAGGPGLYCDGSPSSQSAVLSNIVMAYVCRNANFNAGYGERAAVALNGGRWIVSDIQVADASSNTPPYALAVGTDSNTSVTVLQVHHFDCSTVTTAWLQIINTQNIMTLVIKTSPGYNPVGSVTVTVPASGTAVAAEPYDRTFYATAGTDAVTLAIENGPTVKVPANAMGTVRVPAGKTLTPTYTATHPPTWVVEGE